MPHTVLVCVSAALVSLPSLLPSLLLRFKNRPSAPKVPLTIVIGVVAAFTHAAPSYATPFFFCPSCYDRDTVPEASQRDLGSVLEVTPRPANRSVPSAFALSHRSSANAGSLPPFAPLPGLLRFRRRPRSFQAFLHSFIGAPTSQHTEGSASQTRLLAQYRFLRKCPFPPGLLRFRLRSGGHS